MPGIYINFPLGLTAVPVENPHLLPKEVFMVLSPGDQIYEVQIDSRPGQVIGYYNSKVLLEGGFEPVPDLLDEDEFFVERFQLAGETYERISIDEAENPVYILVEPYDMKVKHVMVNDFKELIEAAGEDFTIESVILDGGTQVSVGDKITAGDKDNNKSTGTVSGFEIDEDGELVTVLEDPEDVLDIVLTKTGDGQDLLEGEECYRVQIIGTTNKKVGTITHIPAITKDTYNKYKSRSVYYTSLPDAVVRSAELSESLSTRQVDKYLKESAGDYMKFMDLCARASLLNKGKSNVSHSSSMN